ncbi:MULTISPECIES: TIGR03089 family protein [unclassified Arthrobacter]|uniref:TIGR03089 family protein n=1 Tax=unclassified Arthrobacter TaxID=235627 RepID=UPI001493158D|nr:MULTISPECIES: TIGR03089 family protein [unclassified Arthrobacter]MBE0009024.1 TIGR03089 family protein [Arthrobacter sp. AET 35A]NOJ60800.1 TIGR03089 family protein [Arthrobacter sp. 260]NOJ62846.1 TIGR03089 family protein [Arthrobacter sp. 147(2020)]
MAASTAVPHLMHQLRTVNPSAPRLIWYGPNSERIELSGRVLDNWVAKTSNLLVEELDAVPGTRVNLLLPGHWKTLVWALACWQVGAVPVASAVTADTAADIVVSSDDTAAVNSPSQLLVLVALGALDLKYPGTIPAGAVDYAAEVRGYGDEFLDLPPAIEGQTAMELADGGLSMPVLFDRAAACGWTPGGVLLVPADLPLETTLAAAVHCWTTGGTLIVAHASVELSADLVASERVTDRVGA